MTIKELEKQYEAAKAEYETASTAWNNALNLLSNTEKWKELSNEKLTAIGEQIINLRDSNTMEG
jgi:recombinational DNA repair ATPase RecF